MAGFWRQTTANPRQKCWIYCAAAVSVLKNNNSKSTMIMMMWCIRRRQTTTAVVAVTVAVAWDNNSNNCRSFQLAFVFWSAQAFIGEKRGLVGIIRELLSSHLNVQIGAHSSTSFLQQRILFNRISSTEGTAVHIEQTAADIKTIHIIPPLLAWFCCCH